MEGSSRTFTYQQLASCLSNKIIISCKVAFTNRGKVPDLGKIGGHKPNDRTDIEKYIITIVLCLKLKLESLAKYIQNIEKLC